MEFNPDGSIKLSSKIAEQKAHQERRMEGRCIKITKEVVQTRAPKRCVLHVRASKVIGEEFVPKIHSFFKQAAQVPTKITRISPNEFEIEIGTCFRRCQDCTNLIGRYRQTLDGNIIEKKGNCTFEGRNFAYEDYFE